MSVVVTISMHHVGTENYSDECTPTVSLPFPVVATGGYCIFQCYLLANSLKLPAALALTSIVLEAIAAAFIGS